MKEEFHIAKLSLFNTRLLHAVERARDVPPVGELVDKCSKENSVSQPANLMHQATYLAHAYVCLVWLLEIAKKQNLSAKIYESVEARVNAKVSGPSAASFFDKISEEENTYGTKDPQRKRDMKTASGVLPTCRNAVAHGSVTFFVNEVAGEEVQMVRFADVDPKTKEKAKITMSLFCLGTLSDAVLFSMNDLLYPRQ
jgi:hypothetical protein